MRARLLLATVLLCHGAAFADENSYLMNFDLITKSPDGEVGYHIQFQGIRMFPEEPFHGEDLGEFDYFLTVSDVDGGEGTLTVELYQYESRRKTSDVASEIVAVVDFTVDSPARFKGKSERFGVDLAFSISPE